MFEKFSNIIEGKFAGPLEKLSNQRHLRAIRDGIIATLPIIIVSSLLMVVAFSYNQMPESWALWANVPMRRFSADAEIHCKCSSYFITI